MSIYNKEERQFIIQNTRRLRDEDVMNLFISKFHKEIQIDTLRRIRQRAGIRKDNKGRLL